MPTALLIVPILTFLIFVHELGHYTMARRAGVKVEEFGFGLPPRLWGIQRGETLWSINWIPLGGFVRVLGEDGKNFSERSMQSKTAGQRALFLAAGSIMNFITAFVLIAILLFVQGEPTTNLYVTDVLNDSPAAVAGIQPGDQILEAGGRETDTTGDFRSATSDHLNKPMDVTLLRAGEVVTTQVTPDPSRPVEMGVTGVRIADVTRADIVIEEIPEGSAAAAMGLEEGDRVVSIGDTRVIDIISYEFALERHLGETVTATVVRDGDSIQIPIEVPDELAEGDETFGATIVARIQFERPSPVRVLPMAVGQFFDYIRLMFEGLIMILNGEVPLSQVSGPIGMGQLTSEIVEESTVPAWVAVMTITIILSLNLGLLNLLPLPALDGGRLLFVAIEVLRRGKRVAPEKEGLVHFVGLVLLLGFMIMIAFVDIERIISGQSFIQ